MAATNRAAKITKLVSGLKKQYKPDPAPSETPLLETLLLGCLLENSMLADAQQAFSSLREGFFDWNEVRVTTKAELAEVCRGLNDPPAAAARVKGTLQSVFETFYAFDIEPLKKQNLGQAVTQLEGLDGVTPFVVSFAVQSSLGGHSIPVNAGLLTALTVLGVITPAEASLGGVPGLERAVPKNQGREVGSLLHQLGVEVGRSPYGQTARKRLLALDPGCKERLPKRPPAPSETEAAGAHATGGQAGPRVKKAHSPARGEQPGATPAGAGAGSAGAKGGTKRPMTKSPPAPAKDTPHPKKAESPGGTPSEGKPASVKKAPAGKKPPAAKKAAADKKPAAAKKTPTPKKAAPAKRPAAAKKAKKATPKPASTKKTASTKKSSTGKRKPR